MKTLSRPKPPVSEASAGYRAPAVVKAFRILRHVARSPDAFGLSDLARDLGFSKSTTSGLIQALLHSGALDREPGGRHFSLGPAIMDLAGENPASGESVTRSSLS